MSEQADEAPDLIFEEPGGGKRGPSRGVQVWLVKLRNHPGQWARFPESVHVSTAYQIKRGAYGGVAGEFEAVNRRCTTDRTADLYVRYIGEVSA